MRPDYPSRPDDPGATRARPTAGTPPVSAAPGEIEWDEILLTVFGPRHWNLGCG